MLWVDTGCVDGPVGGLGGHPAECAGTGTCPWVGSGLVTAGCNTSGAPRPEGSLQPTSAGVRPFWGGGCGWCGGGCCG